MARQRSPKWDEARKLFIDSGGQKQLKDIGVELGVSADQIRKWKGQDKKKGVDWDELSNGHVTNEFNGHVTNQKPEKRSAPAPPSEDCGGNDEDDARSDLTPKQRLFVAEFLIDLNATQAAIRAGYSEKTAYVQGPRLLENVRVREVIDRGLASLAGRAQIDANWVVQRLIRMADYNVRDFAWLETEKVEIKKKNGDVLQVAVQSVKFNEDFDGTIATGLSQGKDGIKLDLPDRVRALELLGKYTGVFDSHKRRVDERRLELEARRLAIEEAKAKSNQQPDNLVIKVKLPEVNIDADD